MALKRRPLRIPALPATIALSALAAATSVAGRSSAGSGGCDHVAPTPYPVQADTGFLPVPDGGEVGSHTILGLPVPFPFDGTPRVRITASADLGLASEQMYIRARTGGFETPWRQIPFDNETDCAMPPNCTNVLALWDVEYPPPEWTGELELQIFVTPSVNAKTCPDGFVRVEFQYVALADDDCNGNRRNDACDIAEGLLADCDGNNWADECQIARFPESDCNGNGLPDCCDAQAGARDCNRNGTLDECEIKSDASLDCDGSGLIDACEVAFGIAPDADLNGIPDACDIASGRLADCDGNGLADIAEVLLPGNDVDGDLVLDACDPRSPDINADGSVGAPDLSTLLDRWGTANPPCDLDRDGSVGAPDLSLVLASWGPIPICGNGVLNLGENCCNCPEDASCGPGFDCFYGSCLPCVSGECPGKSDACLAYYGAPPVVCYGCSDPTYGVDELSCYGRPLQDLNCATAFTSPSRTPGFSMHLLDARRPDAALASLGVLLLVTIPRGRDRRRSR